MPLGPCSLCPDSDSMSIRVDFKIERDLAHGLYRVGMEQRAGAMRHFGEFSTGNNVPVSLFADITDAIAVRGPSAWR